MVVKEIAMKEAGMVLKYGPPAIVPNRWQGEYDCWVGPFSSRTVAEYFASAVVDFGAYESFSHRIFAKGDSWYVEVQPSGVPEQEPLKS